MNELITQLTNNRHKFIEIINKYPVQKINEIIFDKWSLKNIIAHLSGWDVFTVNCLQNFKQGKTVDWGEEIDEFNQKSIEIRKNFSWKQTYDEFIEISQKNIEEYQSLTNFQMNQLIWPNREITPTSFLKIDIDHYREHLKSINSKL